MRCGRTATPRTKSKAEVDFVIEEKGNLIPAEIKSNLIKPKLTKSFYSFIEKYRPKKGIIFSEGLFSEKGKLRFRPIFSVSREI